jgi:ElaB/YqjD/DUF883 family membrane-anchored ribosome-binding protein
MRGAKHVSEANSKRGRMRAWTVLVVATIGLTGLAAAGCGSSSDETTQSSIKQSFENGLNEATTGVEKGIEEAKEGLKGSKSEAKKSLEKAQAEAEKGIEKGKKQVEKGVEEAEKYTNEKTP